MTAASKVRACATCEKARTLTVNAFAGTSMMSQWSCLHNALNCGTCRRSSGANRPHALAMGRIPFRTNEGSFGRRKCFGRGMNPGM